MTTRDKGITLPRWSNVRLSNTYVEVSSSLDFSSNATYKYGATGVSPTVPTALIAAAPQSLNLVAQNANLLVAGPGADVNITPGIGSIGGVSGNLVLKNTAGVGGTWNTSHAVLGTYHIWIDTAARVRIKNGVPTSDQDGNVIALDLSAVSSYTPGLIANGAAAAINIGVASALMGDIILSSFSLSLQGLILSAYVSAINTVTVRFQNQTGAAVTLAAGNITLKIITQ